ncbi:cytosolic acyl coenzyme A thioester hydrolase-like [Tubulanus polymorphus]|uniref:cytosolic acyl coenzyme A thioester hydrolase-like n=1 Tax=Tubulanus polymorphus TaxID=672921 RepID=UPI003DA576EB
MADIMIDKNLIHGITCSKRMLPDDANPAGNVHGGNILKMIEEAGYIITTRYCNKMMAKDATADDISQLVPVQTALVRVERMDFLEPMYIGEVAEASAEITYTAAHSLEVMVKVWAENIEKGTKRLTNEAHLWYVPCDTECGKVATVPRMSYDTPNAEAEGRKRYLQQKEERVLAPESLLSPSPPHSGDISNNSPFTFPERYTVRYSQTTLSHLVTPSDCTMYGNVAGGVLMKLMDNCAGVVAAKHCHSNVVTACVDTIDFKKSARLSSLLTIQGRAVFTSSRTIEVELIVDAETMESFMTQSKIRAVQAYYTFVSLDKTRKTLPIEPLNLISDGEKKRFEERRLRYENRKANRAKRKQLAEQSQL